MSISVSGGAFVVAVFIACVVFWRRKQKLQKRKHKLWETAEKTDLTSIINNLNAIRVRPKVFSYEDLVLATNNFSNDKKLGEGGWHCLLGIFN